MSLAAGSKLGPYEVLGPLGAGGMGVVLRARDARLNRDVALKLLPELFAADADRLTRFEREAQTLAALNHPHIAQIHGVEDGRSDTGAPLRALVMELVEGEDLSARIARGPIPLDEALPIARQIADALETAHEQNIVHRDLKPANIKVRSDGTVKVLDFGLAKALGGPESGSMGPDGYNLALSPTFTSPATMAGTILGTAAYMAPEQAKGKAVDRRADIWAFGVVLYEMLTGRQLFAAETVAETIGLVVMREPDLAVLPEGTPPRVRELIRRCLERDPKQRLRDAGEARITLSSPAEPAGVTPHPPARRTGWIALACAGAVIAVAAGVVIGRMLAPAGGLAAPAFAFDIAIPGKEIENGSLALSPDGTHLAFRVRASDGSSDIWVRPLGSYDAKPLGGTRDLRTSRPFWSPDGRELGFLVGQNIWRAPIDGGPARRVGTSPLEVRGAAWGGDDAIVFGTEGGPIYQVDAGGTSQPKAITSVDSPKEDMHVWPAFLPDGRQFVFLADAGSDEGHRIRLAAAGTPATNILLSGVRSAPAIDPAGALLLSIRNQLVAYPFDFTNGTLARASRLVADEVVAIGDRHELPAASGAGGIIAYQRVGAGGDVVRVALDGTVLATLMGLDRYRSPVVSPDGARIAFDMVAAGEGGGRLVWIHDVQRGVRTLLSERGGLSDSPAWSADGQTVYFTVNQNGWKVFRKAADGAGAPEPVGAPEKSRDLTVLDASRDGKYLLVTALLDEGNWDLYLLPLGERNARWKPWAATPALETRGRFSKDGRWIAFVSTASGGEEVFVSPVDDPSRRWQISANGGNDPVWSPDGTAVLYRTPADQLMAADIVIAGGEVRAGAPRQLFELRSVTDWSPRNVYDIMPDGKSIILNRRLATENATIHVKTGATSIK